MNSVVSKLIKKYGIEKMLSGNEEHGWFFSIKKMVRQIADGNGEVFPPEIWESVECASVCEDTDFTGFIRDIRTIAFQHGQKDIPMYGGVLRTISRMMARNNHKQNRLDWITADMKTARKGDMLLFVGDLPYYEEVFAADLRFNPLNTARSAIRLLNAIGIKPVVLHNEVSSGHDELFSGDVETFMKLAEKNIRALKKSGAKEIITLDSESFYTLKVEYPRFFKDFKILIFHLTQMLSKELKKLHFRKLEEKTAYHDPCRLGRDCKVFDGPRKVLEALLQGPIVEMRHSREETLCTAAHRFSNDGAIAKRMQVETLKEAENAGAEILVTSCPREAIILKLAARAESWKETNIQVRELTELAAELYIDGKSSDKE
jgi:Fe-S oxidoreductase